MTGAIEILDPGFSVTARRLNAALRALREQGKEPSWRGDKKVLTECFKRHEELDRLGIHPGVLVVFPEPYSKFHHAWGIIKRRCLNVILYVGEKGEFMQACDGSTLFFGTVKADLRWAIQELNQCSESQNGID